ncbi:unnamed protein product [Clavelina lepadiformis]|uniref:Uncharacterized protein n=1 Tax=Clavelina lepadiformis TaxID=159417 RepID=A0ABP0EX07_CLALP
MAQFMMSMAPGFGGMQTGFAQPVAGNAQWTITAQERGNYDQQFNNLQPVNGFLRGDQARNFFLQSNLPPPVLGQIWELADFTGDGKMDKLEFAIAMKLIKLQLQGVMLPATLPASMKQTTYGTTGFGTTTGISSLTQPTLSNGGSSTMNTTQPAQSGGFNPNSSTSASSSTTSVRSSTSQEWSVPKASKLKYNQVFNANDRTKSGYLSSMQARHVLSGTGLPQMTLAKIWQLSDIDNDGKLSQEEFVLAMHLSDMAKSGSTLPTVLPQHLIPPSYRTMHSTSQAPAIIGQLGLLTPLTQMEAIKTEESKSDNNIFSTFEDKRRDNFQKGNLELEKRRLALLESQQKERERLEQKEKEQREKREKERLEQERKRQEQLERQLERQRAVEREKEEQRRKAIEQKEAAQREMERQRQLEWERIRRKELLQHKLREQELVMSLQAKTKTLDVELSSHREKKSQLQQRVKDVETRLKEHTDELKIMNKQRELKHTLVQAQQQQMELFHQQFNALTPEKQKLTERVQFKGNSAADGGLQPMQRDYQSKVFTLQRLRTQLQETEDEKSKFASELVLLNSQLNNLREDLSKQALEMERLNRIQQDKIRDLQDARRKKEMTITRKSSMEENKKQQEKLASAALLRRQESEKRQREEGVKKMRELQEKAEKERKRMAEEAERRKRQEEEEAKKKEEEARAKAAEDEVKKAEIKRKIAEMQQERLKQKQQQASAGVAATASAATAKPGQGRGFQLVLSKDPANLVKYRALYNFSARNADELSINIGDIVTVDTSQVAEPDWLAGSKSENQYGWFPANYVEKIAGPVIQPPPQSAKPTHSRSTFCCWWDEAVHISFYFQPVFSKRILHNIWQFSIIFMLFCLTVQNTVNHWPCKITTWKTTFRCIMKQDCLQLYFAACSCS